jgi:hypothetical protein
MLVLILHLLLDSLNILTDDVFKACFEDYLIDENIFPSLGEEKLIPEAR